MLETLIFFDTETTGLPRNVNGDPLFGIGSSNESRDRKRMRLEKIILLDSANMPRITEMSFLAVSRQSFATAACEMQLVSSKCCRKHVHVLTSAHTRQLNPQLNDIEWEVYEVEPSISPATRLTREELERMQTFRMEWPTFVQFLELCPKPACLVAHNGIRFDFRILFHELRRARALSVIEHEDPPPPIPANVFFLDSLESFIALETQCNNAIKNVHDKALSPIESLLHPFDSAQFSAGEWCLKLDRIDRRDCFIRTTTRGWHFDVQMAYNKLFSRGTFQLKKLHARLFPGLGQTFHRAQRDCEALLQVALSYGADFLTHADGNCASRIGNPIEMLILGADPEFPLSSTMRGAGQCQIGAPICSIFAGLVHKWMRNNY